MECFGLGFGSGFESLVLGVWFWFLILESKHIEKCLVWSLQLVSRPYGTMQATFFESLTLVENQK